MQKSITFAPVLKRLNDETVFDHMVNVVVL